MRYLHSVSKKKALAGILAIIDLCFLAAEFVFWVLNFVRRVNMPVLHLDVTTC